MHVMHSLDPITFRRADP